MGAVLETYLLRPVVTLALLRLREASVDEIVAHPEFRKVLLETGNLDSFLRRFDKDPPDNALVVLISLIRELGKPYEDVPINSNYVVEFEKALERADLGNLLWSPLLHALRRERPSCGLVALREIADGTVPAQIHLAQPGFREIADIFEEMRWAERDLVTVWT